MQYLKLSALLLLPCICLAGFTSTTALADEQAAQTQTASEPEKDMAKTDEEKSADSSAAGEHGQVLHGGVRGSAIRLEEGLGMIESSSRLIQNSALEVSKECTRKETTVMRGPNYIGNGIVIPALGGSGSGIVQAGELPARKDKVEAFLSTAESTMKALRTHVDGLIIPENSPEKMTNLWRGMHSSMQAAENNITAMRDIVSQVPVKKGEIKQKDAKPLGRAALKVYDSMTALAKMRDQLEEMIKTELKN